MTKLPFAAVVASAPVTAATAGLAQALLSLSIGMVGVTLARTIFVGRENQRLKRKQQFGETFPLTAAAMLIAGVIIWDRQLGISMAAFTRLGVGWVAVLALDVLGQRAIEVLRVLMGAKPNETPPDMLNTLQKLDEDDTPTA